MRLIAYASAVVIALLIGFAWSFYQTTILRVQAPVESIDGIAILTGGAQRLAAGADIIDRGFQGPVLVTGVYPGVEVETLFAPLGIKGAGQNQIDLDYQALSTIENARQIQNWAEKNGLETVMVITSDYHLPRSLELFSQYAPNLRIIPQVVESKASIWVYAEEYIKYIAVKLYVMPLWLKWQEIVKE